MSDTPRTKAATRMAFSGEYMVPIQDAQKLERELAQSKEANAGLMRACEKYERELAEAREDAANQRRLADMALAHRDIIIEERDTLETALKEIYNVSVFDYDTMPEEARRKYREVVLKITDGALSMKKRGSHE